jgi:hypothetical protein
MNLQLTVDLLQKGALKGAKAEDRAVDLRLFLSSVNGRLMEEDEI